MRPLTMTHLHQLLQQAIDTNDGHAIAGYGAMMDSLEQEAANARGFVSLGAAALWYAEQHLMVFPLQPGAKIPFKGSRGCKDATSEPERIRGWWQTRPDSNIGIATGHLVDVVDVDGPGGRLSQARSIDLFASLRIVGAVNTPRPGGGHLYVPATGLGNKAGMLPGVDYRGTGGYVVAPPSLTETGVYEWTVPLDLDTLRQAAA